MRAVVEVVARRPAPVVWRHLTDWPWQSASIPLTRVFSTGPDSFVGRTAVLGVGFDDPMDVVRRQDPTAGSPADGAREGVAVLAKRGSVVRGSAALRVVPLTAGSCLVVWGEDVDVLPRRLPRALARPLDRVLAVPAWWGLRGVVVDMVRRVEAERPEPLEA